MCDFVTKNFTKEGKVASWNNPTKYTVKWPFLLSIMMHVYLSLEQCYHSCSVLVDLCCGSGFLYWSSQFLDIFLHLLDSISSLHPHSFLSFSPIVFLVRFVMETI